VYNKSIINPSKKQGVTTLHHLQNFRRRKLPEENNSGYDSLIWLFDSHVMPSLVGPTQTISPKRYLFLATS